MKVLIFTHKSDIDGMGGAILSKLAFENVDYVLCETFSLQNEIAKYFKNQKIYEYDMIFLTDLWLEEPTLTKVALDEKLKNKFFVFDHHKSALEENFNKYDFTTIKISDEKGRCSGTSLFYEYLISNKYLKNKKAIEDFVELTRRYDTWEWKNIYNDEKAHELTLLFDILGRNGYITTIFEKLKNIDQHENFEFSDSEKMIINNKKEQVEEKIKNYINKIYYKEVLGYRAGIIFIDYEYRNDIAEYIRENKIDIDFVMLIALDYGTISYRKIKEGMNVRKIAEKFGGKGHDGAASSPISSESIGNILNILTNI